MREYGKLQTTFWTSDDIRGMSDDAKMLAAYLLTGPHTTLIGCFRLPDGYVHEDLNWDLERVSKGFLELSSNGFITRDSSSKWLVIHKFLKWNKIENPNQGKSAVDLYDQVPDKSPVKPVLARAIKEFAKHFPVESLKGFETLSEPFRNQKQEQEQKQEQKQEPEQNQEEEGSAPTSGTVAKKPKGESETAQTWEAYSTAYFARYGTEPVRNASVNGKLAQFVSRLGREEAPHVARFFVGHNNGYYVREMHAVGALLKDAEKLRTEWATNSRMTQTKALQADKTATNLDAFAPLIAAARAKEEAERNANAI